MHIHHNYVSISRPHRSYNRDVYTSLPSHLDPCVCTTVKKLSRVLGRTYDAEVSPAGISITQLGVLRCIARRRGEPLVRIAEEMEMDRTSLYRALAPMIRDGWIVPSQGTGARFRTARITPKGQRLLSQANKSWRKVQQRILRQFGKTAYRALVSELHRLAECAGEANL